MVMVAFTRYDCHMKRYLNTERLTGALQRAL